LFVRTVQRNVPRLDVTIQFEPRPPNPAKNQFAVALMFWPINVSNHFYFSFRQFARCPLNRRKYSLTLLSNIPTTPPLRTSGGNSPDFAFRLTVRLHTPKILSNSGSRIKRSLNL
jgi:hypothetical protein